MSRGPRTSHRKDGNHDAIRAAFELRGCEVLSLCELGSGVPDLLVLSRDRVLRLVEVKQPKGTHTPAQRDFILRWPVFVARTEADVNQLVQQWRGER